MDIGTRLKIIQIYLKLETMAGLTGDDTLNRLKALSRAEVEDGQARLIKAGFTAQQIVEFRDELLVEAFEGMFP